MNAMNGKIGPDPEGSPPWATLEKVLKKAPLEIRRKAAAKLPECWQQFLNLDPDPVTEKTIIYIDMDDTICELAPAYKKARKYKPDIKYPQSIPGFFENLKPVPGAVRAVNELRSRADVYILTAPSVRNPLSYTEKRLWIEKHFDLDFCKKLIITPNKGLLKGDILVDDYDHGKGQENFSGRLIHFGSEYYPDWPSVLNALIDAEPNDENSH